VRLALTIPGRRVDDERDALGIGLGHRYAESRCACAARDSSKS
jgi:hypothetical protein